MKTYSTKKEALRNREAGKKLMKSVQMIATCSSSTSKAGSFAVVKFFWA